MLTETTKPFITRQQCRVPSREFRVPMQMKHLGLQDFERWSAWNREGFQGLKSPEVIEVQYLGVFENI